MVWARSLTSRLPDWHTCGGGGVCIGGAGSMHTRITGTMAVGNVRQAGGTSAVVAAVVAVMEVVVVIGGPRTGGSGGDAGCLQRG